MLLINVRTGKVEDVLGGHDRAGHGNRSEREGGGSLKCKILICTLFTVSSVKIG